MVKDYKKQMYKMIYGDRVYTPQEIEEASKLLAASLFGSPLDIIPDELKEINALVRQMIAESKKQLRNS